jgi:DNA polymerase (family 10)
MTACAHAAFRHAAREIRRMPQPVGAMLEDGSIELVEGIGAGIRKVLEELQATGQANLLKELRARVHPALVELAAIPGIGAKTAQTLVRELGVQDVAELEAAGEAGRIQGIAGFGEKKEQAILQGIKLMRSRGSLLPIGASRPVAEALLPLVRQCDWVLQAELAGSVRRWQELNADIDLVVETKEPQGLKDFLTQVKGVTLREEPGRFVLGTSMELDVNLWLVQDNFIPSWLRFTGSREHIAQLEAIGPFHGATEEEVYRNLGLHFIPPEQRQADLDLTSWQLSSTPPRLVSQEDIRGDLHMHSQWSDGVLDINTLAALAAERGYDYIAVTDHSPSLSIARGLTLERIHQQLTEIRANQHRYPLTVLAGIEVDIKGDGSLDVPDEKLAKLDWVVASVHSNFNLGREQMTARIIRAMENPYVRVIGHASGRLLQRRPGYQLDWEQIIRAAKDLDVALEVNSSPDRLDIGDIIIARAVAAGVKIVINTDAHSGSELDNMRFGVAIARRGGAGPKDVLNTLSLAEFTRRGKGKQ